MDSSEKEQSGYWEDSLESTEGGVKDPGEEWQEGTASNVLHDGKEKAETLGRL